MWWVLTRIQSIAFWFWFFSVCWRQFKQINNQILNRSNVSHNRYSTWLQRLNFLHVCCAHRSLWSLCRNRYKTRLVVFLYFLVQKHISLIWKTIMQIFFSLTCKAFYEFTGGIDKKYEKKRLEYVQYTRNRCMFKRHEQYTNEQIWNMKYKRRNAAKTRRLNVIFQN